MARKKDGCFPCLSVVVQSLSCLRPFVTPWTPARQASLSFTISQSLLKLMSIESVMPSKHLILSSPSHPAFNLSQHQGLFQWVNFSHQVAKLLVSASALVLPKNIQDWFPLTLTGGSPCSPRDAQESSPIPQFKSISFSVLSFLYGPSLPFIHDYWKKHSFDYTDLCW